MEPLECLDCEIDIIAGAKCCPICGAQVYPRRYATLRGTEDSPTDAAAQESEPLPPEQ